MSLFFVCYQCECVDAVDLVFLAGLPSHPEQQQCTLCRTGEWHNQFPHVPYDPDKDQVTNRPTGFALG